jgi:hypothetical protein
VKTDESGITQWNETSGGSVIEQGRNLITTTGGGIALVGETMSYGVGGRDMWLMKLNITAKTSTDSIISSKSSGSTSADTASRTTPLINLFSLSLNIGVIIVYGKYRRK